MRQPSSLRVKTEDDDEMDHDMDDETGMQKEPYVTQKRPRDPITRGTNKHRYRYRYRYTDKRPADTCGAQGVAPATLLEYLEGESSEIGAFSQQSAFFKGTDSGTKQQIVF